MIKNYINIKGVSAINLCKKISSGTSPHCILHCSGCFDDLLTVMMAERRIAVSLLLLILLLFCAGIEKVDDKKKSDDTLRSLLNQKGVSASYIKTREACFITLLT